MKKKFFLTVLIGSLILTVMSILIDLFFNPFKGVNHLLLTFLSNALIVTTLGCYIKYASRSGKWLIFQVFIISYLIGNFNILIEAYIFNVTDRIETTNIMLIGLFSSLLVSTILVYLFGKWKSTDKRLSFEGRSTFEWIWKIAVGDILYLFLYLLAGFILYTVYPQLMDFYGDKIPPFNLMINTQFFRAAIFMGVAILILRNVLLNPWKKAILIGSIFSILGGLAPLLIPDDEVMPAYIRFGHAFEVLFSNFIYGVILTFMFNQKIKE